MPPCYLVIPLNTPKSTKVSNKMEGFSLIRYPAVCSQNTATGHAINLKQSAEVYFDMLRTGLASDQSG